MEEHLMALLTENEGECCLLELPIFRWGKIKFCGKLSSLYIWVSEANDTAESVKRYDYVEK